MHQPISEMETANVAAGSHIMKNRAQMPKKGAKIMKIWVGRLRRDSWIL